MASAAADGGVTSGGPRLGEVTLAATGPSAGTLRIPVALADAPPVAGSMPGAPPVPLAAATFQPGYVKVNRFDSAAWAPVPLAAGGVRYQAGPDSRIEVDLTGLQAGWVYRVTIDPPAETPVVDQAARPLQPPRFSRNFQLAP